MPLLPVLVIGALCGVASTVGIYFVRGELGKHFILAAGTLRGAVVALLAALTVGVAGTWLSWLGYGALYGVVVGLMIALSHGPSAPRHVLYIAPPSGIAGLLSGALIKLFVAG